mgnify:CR=1 FL=1
MQSICERAQQGDALEMDLLLLLFNHQQDHNNNKANNRQTVLATINLLRALLMLLVVGATEWSPSIIRSNRCLTNGMG